MARSAPAISTFTAGEISPRLEGRVTIEKYREGLSELTNMIVQPHGGVTRRPGTEYLGEVKDSSSVTRLIPFEFKTSDTYALEFGNQYMRVFRNGLQVLEDSEKTVTAVTQANPGVFTASGHGLSNGDEVYLYNDSGDMTELAARNYLVANSTPKGTRTNTGRSNWKGIGLRAMSSSSLFIVGFDGALRPHQSFILRNNCVKEVTQVCACDFHVVGHFNLDVFCNLLTLKSIVRE